MIIPTLHLSRHTKAKRRGKTVLGCRKRTEPVGCSIIALPNQVKKIKGLLHKDARWCYLGSQLSKREKIARVLKAENRFYLKAGLHEKAEALSQSYLDFVASLGSKQKNHLNWWASKFASKSHMQTDFFLLLCYKAQATELMQQRNNQNLVIFIEDPWLFIDLRDSYRFQDINFLGRPNLFLIKSCCLVRGLIHRMLLIGWLIFARLLIYHHHQGKKPQVLEREKKAVTIINPAERRAFKDGNYIDNYLPGLARFYEQNSIYFFYLYLLRFPLSTAKYVGKNREILWPLITDAKFSQVVKRLFEYWRPVFNPAALKTIAEYNASILLQREKWLEFSSAGFNVLLVLFDALDNFFKRNWCATCIYVFENQPWEKMLCMAALKNKVKAIGYQHSSIWRFFLSQFIGKQEAEFVPLPHRLVTSGRHFAELYKQGGIPQEKIVVGGAWRYQHIRDNLPEDKKHSANTKPIILISLCLDIAIAKSMLMNLKLLSEGYTRNQMKFWLKPHPGSTRWELNKLKELISQYRIVDQPLSELSKDVDVVISSSSTVSLEAFLYGKKSVSFIPENLLVTDPLSGIQDKRIYRWYEGENIDMDFFKDTAAGLNLDTIDSIKKRYFGQIDYSAWLKCISI